MADPIKDVQQMLAALLDAGRRDAQVMECMQAIRQALADLLALKEKDAARDAVETAPPVMPAPIVNVSPTMQSDWTTLEIDAPVDGLGRPTGKMTIKKVK
jgi:hypothetical protein